MIVFIVLYISLLCGSCLTQGVPGQSHTSTQSQIQIQKLSEEVDFLKSALNDLILRDQAKEKILTELKSDNAKLLQRVEKLEVINAKLEKEILHKNKTTVSSETNNPPQPHNSSETSIHSRDNGNDVLPAVGTSNRENKWSNTSSKRLLEGDVQRRVAFTARYANSNHALNLSQTIVFDYVHANIGGRYNEHTGVFSVDTAGVYVFFVNIICRPHQEVHTELVRDGTSISFQYCVGDDRYENGSNMVVAELPVGVSMWVRTRYVQNNDVSELSIETTFTGFLLYEN